MSFLNCSGELALREFVVNGLAYEDMIQVEAML